MLRRPSPRRPPLSAPRGQLRAAYRLSAGLSSAAVARAEAVAEREIEALLAQPDFRELLEALEEFQDLPEEERLRRLERHAWCVLEMALADSDWRAAAFVADQLRRGFNPARMLAKGVLKAQARAAAPPPTPAIEPANPRPPRPYRPYDAVGAAIGRATAGLRAAVVAETALAHASDRQAPKPVAPATAASEAPTLLVRPRRPEALVTRLRGGTAARPVSAADLDPRGLLRAWAQGP
jgi:hypothetical protein